MIDGGKEKGRQNSPIALARAALLGFVGVHIDVARLGEVAGKMLVRVSGPVGETSVVAVSVLVGASHCSAVST